jgi:hypothetical protein
MASFTTKQLGRDLREGEKEGKEGIRRLLVVSPFEGSRFGSGVETRYLQATWVWGGRQVPCSLTTKE